MSDFVKITDCIDELRSEIKKYAGCIVKKIDSSSSAVVFEDAKTGEYKRIFSDLVTNAEEPADILDQPCYKDVEGFEHGDWILDEDKTVYKVVGVDGPLVKGRATTDSWSSIKYLRADKVTKLDPNGDNVVGEDFVTGEPIFEYDEDNALTIHGFNRYGGVTDLGQILPFNSDHDDVVGCYDCDELFYRNCDYFDSFMHYSDADDYWICESCYEDNWCTCDECGYLMRSDDAYYDEDNERYLCRDCYENSTSRGKFHDYSYKPCPIFHDLADNGFNERTPYLGVELEIDEGNKEEAVSDLYALSQDENLFYMKHDGSLGYNGIEIVTHPCDLGYHMEKFPWNDVASTAINNGYKSHNTSTCGLHVHVSRSAFGENADLQDLTIAKMIILVDRFWDELVNFSRRNFGQLDRWAKKPDAKIYTYDTEDVAITKAKNSGNHDRYKAVNLTNRNTVEFRLFRGTLKVNTILATLQFLSNMLDYAKATPLISIQESKWLDVAMFHEYPELKLYLEDRELVNVPDKPAPVEPKQIKNRFSTGDIVWFATDNTDNEPMRGIVQNVYRDDDCVEQPLYVVNDSRDRVNFLIDEEIFDDARIAELEATAIPF